MTPLTNGDETKKRNKIHLWICDRLCYHLLCTFLFFTINLPMEWNRIKFKNQIDHRIYLLNRLILQFKHILGDQKIYFRTGLSIQFYKNIINFVTFHFYFVIINGVPHWMPAKQMTDWINFIFCFFITPFTSFVDECTCYLVFCTSWHINITNISCFVTLFFFYIFFLCSS